MPIQHYDAIIYCTYDILLLLSYLVLYSYFVVCHDLPDVGPCCPNRKTETTIATKPDRLIRGKFRECSLIADGNTVLVFQQDSLPADRPILTVWTHPTRYSTNGFIMLTSHYSTSGRASWRKKPMDTYRGSNLIFWRLLIVRRCHVWCGLTAPRKISSGIGISFTINIRLRNVINVDRVSDDGYRLKIQKISILFFFIEKVINA